MNRTIDRLKLVFLGLFALGAVGVWAYQLMWVRPAKQCEAQQSWWDASTRTCATPIYIPDITGRPEGMSRREWSELQAARKVEAERLGAVAAAEQARATEEAQKAAADKSAPPPARPAQ